MCAAISSWYTAQYANWNRTRRLSVPPYVATESNVRATTASRLNAADALILNINDVNNLMGTSALALDTAKKADTLFGPGVGVISSGPDWTESKHVSNDELTPEVVKGWIAKSEEASNPTTTLQALVNLKRPSIKLSPLDHNDPSEGDHHGQHGLEFEFDCDAPKCAIKMHAIGQPDSAKILVFDKVVEGGFGKVLKYDEGAILDLEQSENKIESTDIPQSNPISSPSLSPNNNTSSGDSGPSLPNGGSAVRNKKRFSNFNFRKRSGIGGQRVVGPALPVVDADASNALPLIPASNDTGVGGTDSSKEKDEGGLKVTIELEALDEESKPLANVNSQMTYLHIVRVGSQPAETPEDDRRPWVVKVVKREATIGAHVFHLHEIYGLSSTAPAPAAVETTQHAYPPTNQTVDDQTSECLLCLSSPREVVLLPCRHLVACKECAVNMVEFGAGGTLVHTEGEPAAAATEAGDNGGGAESAAPANGTPGQVAAPVVTAAVTQRRKRKAKGWYCPVCRQPYTSLLRITTTPPEKECTRDSTSEENVVTSTVSPTVPPPAVTANANDMRSLFPRPNFLRSFSRGNRVVPPPTGSNMV